MGILDRFGLGKGTSDLLAAGTASAGIGSPWSTAQLSQIVLSDVFPSSVIEALPLTRGDAISVPAVAKGRNLLISAVCKLPLKALNAEGLVNPQPTFLYRTDTAVTPYERMAWTIDDLIFYGYSLWEVTRGTNNQILTANWVPTKDWKVTEGVVVIRDEVAPAESYLFFNSAFEGLLNIANRTLRGARAIEEAWVSRVRNPIPMTVLRDMASEGTGLEQPEIDSLLAQFSAARRSKDGALAYLPPDIALETHGETDAALFVEGRNASRTDIGSFLNIPVAMLDGTIGVDSLTYSTAEGNRNRFYEEAIPFWTDPIEARLSMDDVVPRGQRVRFDKTETYSLVPTPTGPTVED